MIRAEEGGWTKSSRVSPPTSPWLVEFIRALDFERVALCGSASGAQIAVEFARVHPQARRFLVLDNLAHFNADERERMLARYFPDLAPRADNSRLKPRDLLLLSPVGVRLPPRVNVVLGLPAPFAFSCRSRLSALGSRPRVRRSCRRCGSLDVWVSRFKLPHEAGLSLLDKRIGRR